MNKAEEAGKEHLWNSQGGEILKKHKVLQFDHHHWKKNIVTETGESV